MKAVLLSAWIILWGLSLAGQSLTRQDYLQKSKSQKTFAKILTIGGGALILGGLISYASESSSSYYPGKTVGTILMASGAAIATGGIILFSASKRNKQKANETEMAFYLKAEGAAMHLQKDHAKSYYPTISLQLSL